DEDWRNLTGRRVIALPSHRRGSQPSSRTRLTAPRVSTTRDRARPDTPAPPRASSIARPTATASASPAAAARSDGPAPLSTQPSAPAAPAEADPSVIQGKSPSRYGSSRPS